MNKLVESIIKPILSEQSSIKKVIAIYPGRFQPFGPHHKAVYDYLKKKFDDVYIVTSNKQGLPRHPLNFKQKQAHMSKMGVPKSKISMEASPYIPRNLLKKFDPDTTALVFAVGKKDASRLSGGKYFKDYKKSSKDMVGYEEHGYVLIAPHISVKAGGMEVSGTAMRELLGSPKYKEDRERRFKKMFGYFDKKTFELMTTQFGKIFEDEVMIFKPTKMKKGKKKWFDGKGKEILFDLDEDITIPVKVGDTVLMGKWKNKKVKIKDIGVDKHGMPTINGKKATTFRIHNIVNIFDDEKTKTEILNKFLTTIDMKSMIEEASTVGGAAPADDGPSYTYGNFRTYRWRNDKEAEKLGFKVVDYILKPKHKADKDYRIYPDGPIDSVSFFPAGIGTGGTPNNQTNLTGLKGYNRWKKHMTKLAQLVGYKLFDFVNDFKDEKIAIKKDSVETLKHQKEEELDEQALTKNWWKKRLVEGTSVIAAGEPDTGYTAPGKKRYLHPLDMPEGMYQVDFPRADDPYGASDEQQRTYIKKVKNKKELEAPIPSDDSVTAGIGEKGEDFVKSDDIKDFPLISKKVKEDILFTKRWWKNILLEGGAYGHMAHPFDDKNLTFKDLKEIITMGLGGQLNREDNVTEKLDGQNLMISWKDGKLIAARNKGHLKNAGETALDAKGIASKFAGRGSVSDAFSFAMKDLEKAIGSLSQKQKDKIFMNGKAFMNLEVMWPANPNVIDYDKAEIIFHGALEYDDSGSPIGEVKGSGRILQGMIQQINQHIQKHYKIGKPVVLQIPKHQDFGKKKKIFISRLNKLQKQYSLKDNDTLALYHQRFWEEFIYNSSKQMKYKIPNNVLVGLTKRWAFFDKSYKIPQMKKDIKNDKFLDWVISFDKNDHSKWVKDNMIPFEKIFFEVGAEILKNVKGFMAANPNKAVQSMRKQLDKAISDIKSGGDINKIKKIKSQLDKINSMGGLEAIVPSEGIVFKYNGNVYKFTGAFAPVNQITGLAKFG